MNYIVQEIQTTNGVTALTSPFVYADRNAADSKYHTILAAAAISQVEEHGAIMYTHEGVLDKAECYYHGAPAQSE